MPKDADVKYEIKPDGSIDIRAKQGATWEIIIRKSNPDGTPMNLTGWGIRGQIRTAYSAPAVLSSFVFDNDLQNGRIVAKLDAATTSTLPPPSQIRSLVYDFERYQGSDPEIVKKDLPRGRIYIIPEVTR